MVCPEFLRGRGAPSLISDSSKSKQAREANRPSSGKGISKHARRPYIYWTRAARHFRRNRRNYCLVAFRRCPRIVIGLAVVGIAASRSQGCGIAELPVTTKHIFFTVLVATCCLAGSTTFLLGSAANADAQDASVSTTTAHRPDQPNTRLNLLPVFMLQL